MENLFLFCFLVVYKYKNGNLLLIVGFYCYGGVVILIGLGFRVTGVGMLLIVVLELIKFILNSQLLEVLIIGCFEIEIGVIK